MTSHLGELLDALLAGTSLPNLHPALVPFPVALLVTAFGFDLACLLFRRQVWLDRAATALYLLGSAGAGLAFLTGRAAAATATELPGLVQAAILDHRHLALWTLAAFSGLSLLRLLVSWLGRKDKRIAVGAFRLVALAATLPALGLLAVTADRGAALVFKHEVGAAAVQQRAIDTENLEP